MKKSQIFYAFCFILYFSCQSPVKTWVVKSSFDVVDSKEKGVFFAEYIPEIKEFNLGKKELIIDNVWVENLWQYKNYNRDIDILDSKQGLVKFENPDTDIYEIEFTYDSVKNGITGNKLSFKLNEYPDTLILNFMYENKIEQKIVLNKKH